MDLQQARTTSDRSVPTAGYQKWRDLLFLHWRLPAEIIQPLLPARLTVDTFDGSAWLGLVLFHMQGVRPWWFPAVPFLSAFHETNVRTYVRLGDGEPAVWFFSLDAARALAVRIARWRWHLNYYHSQMRIERSGSRISYFGKRTGSVPGDYAVDAEIDVSAKTTPAIDGTLEHFLVERYLLHTQRNDGMLMTGRVYHEPYPLQPAETVVCTESLCAATGLAAGGPPLHAVFSPGVDVRIGQLLPE